MQTLVPGRRSARIVQRSCGDLYVAVVAHPHRRQREAGGGDAQLRQREHPVARDGEEGAGRFRRDGGGFAHHHLEPGLPQRQRNGSAREPATDHQDAHA